MKCPRCETTGLAERDRDGVTADYCRECRGLWMDRGELENLLSRAGQDVDDDDEGPDRDRELHSGGERHGYRGQTKGGRMSRPAEMIH